MYKRQVCERPECDARSSQMHCSALARKLKMRTINRCNEENCDAAFNESGGSDTFFFEQFHRLGGKIIHCAEALSYERVVEERNNEKWLNDRISRDAYNLHLRNKLRFGSLLGSLKSISKISFMVLRYPFFSSTGRRKTTMKIKGILRSISGKPFRAYDKIYGH